jgi:hypothetical protein
METEDLKSYLEIGNALWADPRDSARIATDTISAVNLLNLTPERKIERAAAVLLERNRRAGQASGVVAALRIGAQGQASFFTLPPEQRFALAALHLGRWSYARLGRVLGMAEESVERLAWMARSELLPGAYPPGAPTSGASCPAYDSARPWTQRFLDEEVASARDRLFLQNHLMACDSCRQALNRCRDFYFKVERALPELRAGEWELKSLEETLRASPSRLSAVDRPHSENLRIFLRKKESRWVLAVMAALVIFIFIRGGG